MIYAGGMVEKTIWGRGRDRLRELDHRVHGVNVAAPHRRDSIGEKPEGYWSLHEFSLMEA